MNYSTAIELMVYHQTISLTTQQPVQARSNKQIDSTSNMLGGFFVVFLFISYICIGLNYKKYRKKRKNIQLQQIKRLEKIWKMPANYRKTSNT